jgi:hypothetical protein
MEDVRRMNLEKVKKQKEKAPVKKSQDEDSNQKKRENDEGR